MAVIAVNANSSLLSNYNLKLIVANGKCSADIVLKSFIEYLRNERFNRMVGILGAYSLVCAQVICDRQLTPV